MRQVESFLIQDTEIPPEELFEHVAAETAAQVLLPPDIQFRNAEIPTPPDDMNRPIGLFSSGTTGTPKCIWNSYENLLLNAELSARAFELRGGERVLFMAKPWHVAGFSWSLMPKFVDMETRFLTTKKGEGNHWLEAVRTYEPTHLFTVPAVLRTLYEDSNWFVPNIIFGGSPIYPPDYTELARHADTLSQGYGQTEAGGLISCHKVKVKEGFGPDEHHCYGRPMSEINIRCEGTSSNPKPIYLKSPTAIYRDFYNTGDEGYLDIENRLHLLQRS